MRTKWWATCDTCGCSITIVRHPDFQSDAPPPEDWAERDCLVCGNSLWNQWNSDTE